MWIDIGKLIRENVPDKSGKTLPADLSAGSYDIRDLTNHGIGSLFEGKVIYDKTYGHVTYGCGVCCGYQPPVFWWDPLGISFLGTADNGVDAYDTCDDDDEDVSGSFYGNWTTANSAIATVDTYGTHTGKGMGSTTSSTHGSLQQFRPHSFNCPIYIYQPGGGDNVIELQVQGNPYDSIFVGTDVHLEPPNSIYATVSPSGGNFSESSSVTSDTFTPVQSGGPGWVVGTTTQSTNAGDRALTFTYTLSGQGTVKQTLNVTARQFAYAMNDSPSNTCTLGYGSKYVYTYTPFTHPDKTAVQSDLGLDGTPVNESFAPQPPAGTVTGSGALNMNNQFTDTLAYCSTSPLPSSPTVTQTLSIAGYQVRENSLAFSGSGVQLTSRGPTQ
jgi:hypothetical protein